ncbi:hypothetical protein ACFX15_039021 [Malus domestica]
MPSPAAQINVLGSSRSSSVKTPNFTTPKNVFLGQRLGQTRRVGPLRIVNEKVEIVDLGTTSSAAVAFELERQLVMASYFSRAMLTLRGKLRGTEWDPENSHRIGFSDFWRLLNSNNVQHMEYSNYGKKISVILPYYKDEKMEGAKGNLKEVNFRRHVVDRMPIYSWNDVWQKLHQQIENVEVLNVDIVPAQVYSTVATAVIWSMRLALSIVLYLWIGNLTVENKSHIDGRRDFA